MSKSLVIDAWIREAQEAAKLVEDIETRIKNQNLQQQKQLLNRPSDEIARSKLLEVGVKLDRLESLLHNPHSKPILTNEELQNRWEMLSDIQLRTKSLAVCLYAMSSSNRSGGLADTTETNKKDNICEHDQIKASVPDNEAELLKPLTSDGAPKSNMRVCWIICLIFGAAALLFILIIVSALP